MWTQLGGAILISLLHGLIPSHWLPLVAIGRNLHWSKAHIIRMTLIAATAHAGSTLIIGFMVAGLGQYLSESIEWFTHIVPAGLMLLLGLWFIYRHYTHHHFHLHTTEVRAKNVMLPIFMAMFLSPCLEIESYFLTLGAAGWIWVFILGVSYFLLTIGSMFIWVMVAYHSSGKINAHKWEHNAGIITGVILILSGIFMFYT